MNVYDENTMSLMASPDLSLGYIYPGRRFVAHHEAVNPVTKIDILPGTEQLNGGAGLRGTIVITPGTPAWDEYEECQYYHKYTEEELSAMHGGDFEERLSAVEKNVEDAKEGLTAAKIMLGVE